MMDRIAPTLRPIGQRVVMRQSWRDLLFLHWRVRADVLQPLLPRGLTVDTYEGDAFVGLVPFQMRDVRPVGFPAIPGLSHFGETNVRTYVHHNGGEPGVWFFSLDAANYAAVRIARTLFRLPYFNAHIRQRNVTDEGGGRSIAYECERVRAMAPEKAYCHVRYTPIGTPMSAVPGTLEHFLAERYLLYSHNGRDLFRGQVHHAPYPLESATLHKCNETLIFHACIPRPNEDPPLIHYAAGVDVEVFPLCRVSSPENQQIVR